MSTTTNVPLTITPEAAEHVARLSLQNELNQAIEQARQTMPGLKSILIKLQPAYDLDIPCLVIEPTIASWAAGLAAEESWWKWRGEMLPPQVAEHFALLVVAESPDAR